MHEHMKFMVDFVTVQNIHRLRKQDYCDEVIFLDIEMGFTSSGKLELGI